jgi:hypothetical protein
MREWCLVFLNAGCPLYVVPEGYDTEGKPRMGEWYAFLRFGVVKLIRTFRSLHMGEVNQQT